MMTINYYIKIWFNLQIMYSYFSLNQWWNQVWNKKWMKRLQFITKTDVIKMIETEKNYETTIKH